LRDSYIAGGVLQPRQLRETPKQAPAEDYIRKAKCPGDEDFAPWKIKARGGYLYGTWIRGLGSIACGVVPFGYTQVRPKDETPPPLVEGQKYSYLVDTTNAPGASGY